MSLDGIAKKLKIDQVMKVIDSTKLFYEKYVTVNGSKVEIAPFDIDAFEYIRLLLSRFVGEDEVIKMLSKFISLYIPVVEASVKTLLLAELKNFRPCTISQNFFISDNLIRNGIPIGERELDMMNQLHFNPIDELNDGSVIRRKVYFGNENVNVVDDLRYSPDLNSFIWFVLNVSREREAWHGTSVMQSFAKGDVDLFTNLPNEKDVPKNSITGEALNRLDYNTNLYNAQWHIDNKPYFDSVFTLVNTRHNDNLNIQGDPAIIPNRAIHLSGLHFFFGNAEPMNKSEVSIRYKELSFLKNRVRELEVEKRNVQNEIDKLNLELVEIEEHYTTILFNREESPFNTLTTPMNVTLEEYKSEVAETKRKLSEYERRLVELNDEQELIKADIVLKQEEYDRITFDDYRLAHQNKYYRKPLIQFNFDYVTRTKFLDEKVISAYLVQWLINKRLNVNVSASLSFREELVNKEIEKIIDSVLETDDMIVSDCFFNFSNDKYNQMLDDAERTYNNKEPQNIERNRAFIKEMFAGVDGITSDMSKEEMAEVIGSVMSNVLAKEPNTNTKSKFKLDGTVWLKGDFISGLIRELVNVIARSVLGPKVYLLMLVNQRVTGVGKNSVSFSEWIKSMKAMLVKLIRQIKDMVLRFLLEQLEEVMRDIIEFNLTAKVKEQLDYYLKQLRQALKYYKWAMDWDARGIENIDKSVAYGADLYDQKIDKRNNC